MKEHSEEFGFNPGRIMVGGESAGGGLAAALCMHARDSGRVRIAFQMPLYPMLDDRDTNSSRKNFGPVWNTAYNHMAWRLYLRGIRNSSVPPTAAPARQTDFRGLPPAYTFVGDREPFYCETIAYIERLNEAGVPAAVDVYPTICHAFDMLTPFRKISRQAIRSFERQFEYAAEHYFAGQDSSALPANERK